MNIRSLQRIACKLSVIVALILLFMCACRKNTSAEVCTVLYCSPMTGTSVFKLSPNGELTLSRTRELLTLEDLSREDLLFSYSDRILLTSSEMEQFSDAAAKLDWDEPSHVAADPDRGTDQIRAAIKMGDHWVEFRWNSNTESTGAFQDEQSLVELVRSFAYDEDGSFRFRPLKQVKLAPQSSAYDELRDVDGLLYPEGYPFDRNYLLSDTVWLSDCTLWAAQESAEIAECLCFSAEYESYYLDTYVDITSEDYYTGSSVRYSEQGQPLWLAYVFRQDLGENSVIAVITSANTLTDNAGSKTLSFRHGSLNYFYSLCGTEQLTAPAYHLFADGTDVTALLWKPVGAEATDFRLLTEPIRDYLRVSLNTGAVPNAP